MRRTFSLFLAIAGLLLALGSEGQASRFCKKRRCPWPPVCEESFPRPVSLLFVILARSGGEESRFATLADAVKAAMDKDIIEIRGNGPFLASNIIIKGKELTIRAGQGFEPVIRPHPEDVRAGRDYLFFTDSPIHIYNLTLDGLGLRF